MATEIPLEPLPNQSFSIDLDGRRYDVTIKAVDDQGMVVSITRDGALVVDSARALAGVPVLAYRYEEDSAGNFIFYTEDDALPYFSDFASTCGLVFFTGAELEAIRAST